MKRPIAWILVLELAVAAVISCGKPDEAGRNSSQRAAVKKVDAAGLPPSAAYLPLLDDRRIRVAAPKKWFVSPRSKQYVCQFTYSRSPQVPLPRIRLKVERLEGDDWAAVDSDDPAHARALAAKVAERLKGKSLVEPVLPMVIGPYACARYVDAAVFPMRLSGGAVKKVKAHRQVVCLVHDGRLYRVELHVSPGRILDFRDVAYAVVARLQFVEPEEEPESAAPSDGDAGQAEGGGAD